MQGRAIYPGETVNKFKQMLIEKFDKCGESVLYNLKGGLREHMFGDIQNFETLSVLEGRS